MHPVVRISSWCTNVPLCLHSKVTVRVRLTKASTFVPKSPLTATSGLISEKAAAFVAATGRSPLVLAAAAADCLTSASAADADALADVDCVAGWFDLEAPLILLESVQPVLAPALLRASAALPAEWPGNAFRSLT